MLDISIQILSLSIHEQGHRCSEISWKTWVLEAICSASNSLWEFSTFYHCSGPVSPSVLARSSSTSKILGWYDLLEDAFGPLGGVRHTPITTAVKGTQRLSLGQMKLNGLCRTQVCHVSYTWHVFYAITWLWVSWMIDHCVLVKMVETKGGQRSRKAQVIS